MTGKILLWNYLGTWDWKKILILNLFLELFDFLFHSFQSFLFEIFLRNYCQKSILLLTWISMSTCPWTQRKRGRGCVHSLPRQKCRAQHIAQRQTPMWWHWDAKAVACLHKFLPLLLSVATIQSDNGHNVGLIWVGQVDKASSQLGLVWFALDENVYVSGREHCFNLQHATFSRFSSNDSKVVGRFSTVEESARGVNVVVELDPVTGDFVANAGVMSRQVRGQGQMKGTSNATDFVASLVFVFPVRVWISRIFTGQTPWGLDTKIKWSKNHIFV